MENGLGAVYTQNGKKERGKVGDMASTAYQLRMESVVSKSHFMH